MVIVYHCLTSILFAAALPLLPLICLFSEKRRANLLQRLGLFTGVPEKQEGAFRIWIHALSVGEVNSALPLVQGLRRHRPDAQIIFTASTRTGFQTACRWLAKDGTGPNPVEGIGYFPFDLWFSINRVASRIDPDLVLLVETDLWPGFLSRMKQKKVPVILVNARLSTRAHRGYKRFRTFSGLIFSNFSHIMAQTRLDADRFREVGVLPGRISVAGNIKFDQPPPDLDDNDLERIRTDLGIRPGQKVWVAGSTHEGEETLLVEALGHARLADRGLKLIIAPRNPDRGPALARELGNGIYRTACLSGPASEKEAADILFIDRLGALLAAYAAGSFAFVGGSLVDEGGHNPLEPAMFGRPVLFGPRMTDFHEVARMLVRAGGAEEVGSAGSLAACVAGILTNPRHMEQMGQAAKDVFLSNSGAADRIVEIMEARGFV